MTDEQPSGLSREAWLTLHRHVCRALADPSTDADSLRGVLLALQRAGIEMPELEQETQPKRVKALVHAA